MLLQYYLKPNLNTEENIGITNISNCYIRNGIIEPIASLDKFVFDSAYLLYVKKYNGEYISTDTEAFWAFPIKYKGMSGAEYSEHNLCMNTHSRMKLNVYNDIVRIVNLNIMYGESGRYNILYIDPPYGLCDVQEDEISYSKKQYEFMPAYLLVDKCVDSYLLSPEGQLLTFPKGTNNVIYGFYQLGKNIILFSNSGIFILEPIEGSGFFELKPFQHINTYDIIDIKRTYSTETEIWFVYNNELYLIFLNQYGYPDVKKIGGRNIIKSVNYDDDQYSVFAISSGCVVTSLKNKLSVCFDVNYGFTGVISASVGGFNESKFIIRSSNDDYHYPLISVENLLNDGRLKVIRQIVIDGTAYPNYFVVDIKSDINPNMNTYFRRYFNRSGIAYSNDVVYNLNFNINAVGNVEYVGKVTGITIIYEYVDNYIKYARRMSNDKE